MSEGARDPETQGSDLARETEDQDPRVGDERPGDRHSLALAA